MSGNGWGLLGVHVLRRGGRTSQNRLSDNIIPLFFGRPALQLVCVSDRDPAPSRAHERKHDPPIRSLDGL